MINGWLWLTLILWGFFSPCAFSWRRQTYSSCSVKVSLVRSTPTLFLKHFQHHNVEPKCGTERIKTNRTNKTCYTTQQLTKHFRMLKKTNEFIAHSKIHLSVGDGFTDRGRSFQSLGAATERDRGTIRC